MSVVVTAALLALAVFALIRSRRVQFVEALICVVFGVVLGATPAGPAVTAALSSVGSWAWGQVTSL
ncbi:hypothetical protein [Pengzhenrongella sp.]|jgi:hypothetical protein|uniref:hypothetical protein n=1 Tax=Pengzhenrongella sp. TaxID=2888820 RepID=UPI002F93FA6B